MPKMKYESSLYFLENRDDGDDKKIPLEILRIPVNYFDVEGGAKRRIDLNSTDEISISSEFEQARMLRTIDFYIPPTKDFLAVKLIDWHKRSRTFQVSFIISIYSGRMMTQTLTLLSENALMIGAPRPVSLGSAQTFLLVHISPIRNFELLHGKLDPKRKKIIETEM